jgi:predicted secreted Zn-dependent protease
MNLKARQVATLCAAGGLLVVALAVPGAQALDKPGTISVTDQELRHAHIDIGVKGPSVGDLDVYTSLIYNKRITPRAIGRGTMSCLAVSLSAQNCSATYMLPRGEIVTEGVIGSRLIYQLAVVGGTGLYNNVRGSLTVTSLHRKRPTRELLVFRLVV